MLDGLGEIADRYDVLFCDVWGVVHNGVAAFPEALDALSRFRSTGGTVLLLSNAPRPSSAVLRQLERLHVSESAFDAMVTSGDVTRELLAARPGAAVYRIGPERDLPTFEDLDIRLTSPEEAEIVVCTGLFDDRSEHPDEYRELLETLHARGLPLICANPDYLVDVGGRLLYCAGAIADRYRDMGGETLYAGKPSAMIYEAALSRAERLRGGAVERRRILAVGDALRTDLLGAAGFGIDALFIASGIHAEEVAGPDGPDSAKLARFFAGGEALAVAVQRHFAW